MPPLPTTPSSIVTLPPHFKPLNWFPGHMLKALKDIKERLPKTHGFIEVRDARAPMASGHPQLKEWMHKSNKKHYILLNKMDLADMEKTKYFVDKIQRESSAFVIPCSLKFPKSLQPLFHHWKDTLGTGASDFWATSTFLICGLPNVGKSTLINTLRMVGVSQRKAATTGPHAGVTKRVSNQIKVLTEPKVYLWDTPGIMVPRFLDPVQGWRVALVGGFKDPVVDQARLAECLWHHRHLFQPPPPPHVSLQAYLTALGNRVHAFEKGGGVDMHRAAVWFIHEFRTGKLGNITLDEVT